MARTSTRSRKSKPVRKRASRLRWTLYVIALLALGALVYSAWFWWEMREWRPSESDYPEQGAVIASGVDSVRFETIRALGGQFVYLQLRSARLRPDPGLSDRLAASGKASLKTGLILPFDPCQRADPQSARFTRMVPRSVDMLPPALHFAPTGLECDDPVSEAAVVSEVLTLINQIEAHAGKPVILKISKEFERTYDIASRIDRDLWLERDRLQPDYAGRPWLLWSANNQFVTVATREPIEWVVIQK